MLDEKISFYRNVFLSQYREQKCLVCLRISAFLFLIIFVSARA